MGELRGCFIAVGDFNYPGIRWEMGRSDARGRAFYDAVEDRHFSQHVDEPTHISGNILDLVLSSDENVVQGVQMERRLATSNHELIETSFFLDVKVDRDSEYVCNFARGDFPEMRRRMNDI